MKKIYTLFTCLGLAFTSIAQVSTFTNNFDESIDDTYLSKANFQSAQNGSDLIIVSQGHDEWDGVAYYLNDGSDTVELSMTSNDTIYIRAKADFEGTINPGLSIQLFDKEGVGPNNDQFNGQNRITLTDEYQIFKITVPNWNMTYGAPADPNLGEDTDSTQVVRLNLAPNSGFATYPFTNAENETVNAAFQGTIYIDYISIGTETSAGTEPSVLTTYSHVFDNTDDITSPDAYTVAVDNGSLSITSAGHDEWEYVNVAIPDAVVDITGDVKLGFTASVTPATGFTGPVGIMVTAVDEVGTRIDYANLYTLQDLSTSGETIVIEFDQYINQGDVTINANEHRIASFDILINPGFASLSNTNDANVAINAAFEGVINISDITLSSTVTGLATEYEKQSFSVSPNPASSTVQIGIEGAQESTYAIFNLLGVQVASGSVENNSLDVSSLNTGSYVLTITEGNRTQTSTFVKQ